ncbi:hypothetical protein [Nostoc sp.]|uniref:hypothetical protein n=1 Tax=Nostoc sp. TaxID=1180 RepID=UPI002FFC9551
MEIEDGFLILVQWYGDRSKGNTLTTKDKSSWANASKLITLDLDFGQKRNVGFIYL